MDPQTTIGTGLILLGSKDLILKILGPTADYLGGELKTFTERGLNNLAHIFEIAGHKLGNRINEDGQVPPKILKGIIAEGAFVDDELTAEYFGGVLASSRSQVSRDDRGSALISLISRLSSYQIRTHYIFYYVFKNIFNDRKEELGLKNERLKLSIYMPSRIYGSAMGLTDREHIDIILPHAMFGLIRENLISQYYTIGNKELVSSALGQQVDEDGIIYRITPFGIELFLWAHGMPNVDIIKLLNPDIEISLNKEIHIQEGIKGISSE
jgi:hypothetical protein